MITMSASTDYYDSIDLTTYLDTSPSEITSVTVNGKVFTSTYSIYAPGYIKGSNKLAFTPNVKYTRTFTNDGVTITSWTAFTPEDPV